MKTHALFFMPDNAVADAPAPSLPDALSTSESLNISEYTPPSLAGLDSILEAGGDLPGSEEPTETDQEQKPKPEGKPPEQPKPGEPEKKEKVANLRNAYETSKAELEAARKELAEFRDNHPKVKELSDQIAEVRSKAEALEKERAELDKQLAFHNPAATKAIKELDTKFSAEINSDLTTFPSLRPHLPNLVSEYQGLAHGRPEFDQQFEDFEQKLISQFGENKAARALTMIAKGARYREDRTSLESKLREDSGKAIFEGHVQEWTKTREEFEQDAANFLKMPDGVRETDPYNPLAFLETVAKVEPDKYRDTESKVLAHIREIALGVKPRQKSDFPGMTDDQIAEAMKSDSGRVEKARKEFFRYATQGIMLMAHFRPFLREYKSMQERLSKQVGSSPDPTKNNAAPGGGGGGGGGGSGDVIDVASYVPEPIPSERTFH